MAIPKNAFSKANQQGAAMQARHALATAVRFDRRRKKLILTLDSGLELAFARTWRRVCKMQAPTIWPRYTSAPRVWACTSLHWMRICMSRPCSKGCSDQAAGLPRKTVDRADKCKVRPSRMQPA